MSGQSIIIAGARGTGKSTILRKTLQKANYDSVILYDASGDHKDWYKKPLLSFKEFSEYITKVSNAIIAIEEATIFLTSHQNSDVTDMLVRARHRNNTIIFVFHSLNKVPPYIFELSNKIILLKTNDNEKKVQEKFDNERLTSAFIQLQKMNWISLPNGKRYSPSLVFNIE